MNRKKRGSALLAGITIIFLGISLVWRNEVNLLNKDTVLKEASKEYIEVNNDKINYSNNDKLIVSSGKIDDTTQMVVDPYFQIKVTGNKLKRTVEMYQVDEDCDTDSDGNEQCETEYVWSEDLIDSTFFEAPENNPTSKPFESETFYAPNLKLGAYSLDEDLIKDLPTKDEVVELNQTTGLANKLSIVDNMYTTVNGSPKVGDIRIKYSANKADVVTIMGVQKEEKIEPFIASNGYKVKVMREGNYTGDELIAKLKEENSLAGWIFRIVGVFVISIGFLCLLSFINRIANLIPGLGRIFGLFSIGISLLVGVVITIFVVAVAWLRYRPVLSIGMLALCGLLIFVIVKIRESLKRKNENNVVVTENNSINENVNVVNNQVQYNNGVGQVQNNVIEVQQNNMMQSGGVQQQNNIQ